MNFALLPSQYLWRTKDLIWLLTHISVLNTQPLQTYMICLYYLKIFIYCDNCHRFYTQKVLNLISYIDRVQFFTWLPWQGAHISKTVSPQQVAHFSLLPLMWCSLFALEYKSRWYKAKPKVFPSVIGTGWYYSRKSICGRHGRWSCGFCSCFVSYVNMYSIINWNQLKELWNPTKPIFI